MAAQEVIAIFDIGKTNKKFLLFNKDYQVVYETAEVVPKVKDEDGAPCEDLDAIVAFMKRTFAEALEKQEFDIKAMNFSAHGATVVHLDKNGAVATYMYDYMKKIEPEVVHDFYEQFGGPMAFSQQTGSPVLDMLNSGIQLYWLKHTKPGVMEKIDCTLHLPQFCNYIFSHRLHADITSIGCHTGLWDVHKQAYHDWLKKENVRRCLPDPEPLNTVDRLDFNGQTVCTGIGLHDSSAALLTFLYPTNEPFLLLSSGTWNITLHPFFKGQLTKEDYAKDCLYYLLAPERPVAASRLFLGNEYEHQVKRLEAHFNKAHGSHMHITTDSNLIEKVLKKQSEAATFFPETMGCSGPFPDNQHPSADLSLFDSFEEAYHKLMLDQAYMQKVSLGLICKDNSINRLYVTGGFIQSALFMDLLCAFLPGWHLFTAENKRASALGAALAIHDCWQETNIKASVAAIKAYVPSVALNVSRYQSFFESIYQSS